MSGTRPSERERQYREFIATVSHDLRTPLSAIRSFAETLRAGVDDETMRERFLEKILRHADRLSGMLDRLLATAHIESGKLKREPEAFEVGPFVREIIDGLSPIAAKRRVAVEVETAPGLVAWADKNQLAQILQNLLDNAIKYNRKGGRVAVCVRHDGAFASVEVSDTGLGIPKAELPNLFRKFRRAKSAGRVKGSGLGLYIIRKIVEANGGSIRAESRWRIGSTFSFTLPLATPQLARRQAVPGALLPSRN
jgi:signal transduction histidine kinase